MGFENPMPVQEQVIPRLLQGNGDLVALAQTGTGKTAAYGLPLLQRTDPESMQVQAVVLSPTRELCLQIADDLQQFGKYIDGLRLLAVYGGAPIEGQMRALRRGVHIIVATPGRLIDLCERGEADLSHVSTLILDEADEMLSMGFSDSIDSLLRQIPGNSKTLLFSATMSREVEGIAKNYLCDAEEIVVGSRNEGAEHVNHIYYMVKAKDKYPALKRVVDYHPHIYAIIFCRTRRETQEVADWLIRDGYNAEALHGDLSQAQRDLTMQKFRRHNTQLLVATDVAARGLDVDELTHVINYGLPDDVENYTHRSGRTGRAGRRGTSIAIVHVKEKGRIRSIEKVIGKKFERGTLPTPRDICAKQLYNVIDELEHTVVDDAQVEPFMPEILGRLSWLTKEDLLRRMVSRAFGRFVAYYANEKDIEEADEKTATIKDAPRRERKRGERDKMSAQPEDGYARLFLNLGKKDNVYAREVMGLINRYVNADIEVGRIDLLPQCAFFEVPKDNADIVIAAFRGATRDGRRVVVDRADAPGVKGRTARDTSRRAEGGDRGRKEAGTRRADSEKGSARKEKAGRPANRKERRAALNGSAARAGKESRRGERGSRRAAAQNPFTADDGADWRQFFAQPAGKKKAKLKGPVPDFSEEGWQKKKK